MGIRETFRKDEYPVIIVKNERSSLGSIKSVLPVSAICRFYTSVFFIPRMFTIFQFDACEAPISQ